MKKVDDRVAKNLQIAMKNSQMTKHKAALLIIDGNITKKRRSNNKASMNEKSEDDSKLEKEPTK